MTVPDIQISQATPGDLSEILALLQAVELPTDGVADHLAGFVVARDSKRQLVGCAGVESYGAIGLLRSVAVEFSLQRSGLGSRLVAVARNNAREKGVSEIVLLTTTARDFFAHRFGFKETAREPYEQQLASSAEWCLPRCSSAKVMSLRISQ
jgi:N-acetylglutamate synthase-like GNAT family acetyltransferase